MTTYEQRVDALIPKACRMANNSTEYRKVAGNLCADEVWNREFHRAMDALKYENKLIGWRR